MLRRSIETVVVLIALAVVATLAAARLWPEPGHGFYWRLAALAHMPRDTGPLDLTQLRRRASPNDALVCPERTCQKAATDAAAPIFPVPAPELLRKVGLVALSEPGSAELACKDACDHAGRFVEYSPLFQFPDVIDVSVIEAGANSSTLAIYSRSVFGYWDFEVNKVRIERWLAALKRISSRP